MSRLRVELFLHLGVSRFLNFYGCFVQSELAVLITSQEPMSRNQVFMHVDLGEMWKHLQLYTKSILENILSIIVTSNLGILLQGGIVGNSSGIIAWEQWLFLEASKETELSFRCSISEL